MVRYSRRHHRVAKKEAAATPMARRALVHKYRYKLLAAGVAFVLMAVVKWFIIGYYTGYAKGTKSCD